jgi:hypothetical protein
VLLRECGGHVSRVVVLPDSDALGVVLHKSRLRGGAVGRGEGGGGGKSGAEMGWGEEMISIASTDGATMQR